MVSSGRLPTIKERLIAADSMGEYELVQDVEPVSWSFLVGANYTGTRHVSVSAPSPPRSSRSRRSTPRSKGGSRRVVPRRGSTSRDTPPSSTAYPTNGTPAHTATTAGPESPYSPYTGPPTHVDYHGEGNTPATATTSNTNTYASRSGVLAKSGSFGTVEPRTLTLDLELSGGAGSMARSHSENFGSTRGLSPRSRRVSERAAVELATKRYYASSSGNNKGGYRGGYSPRQRQLHSNNNNNSNNNHESSNSSRTHTTTTSNSSPHNNKRSGKTGSKKVLDSPCDESAQEQRMNNARVAGGGADGYLHAFPSPLQETSVFGSEISNYVAHIRLGSARSRRPSMTGRYLLAAPVSLYAQQRKADSFTGAEEEGGEASSRGDTPPQTTRTSSAPATNSNSNSVGVSSKGVDGKESVSPSKRAVPVVVGSYASPTVSSRNKRHGDASGSGADSGGSGTKRATSRRSPNKRPSTKKGGGGKGYKTSKGKGKSSVSRGGRRGDKKPISRGQGSSSTASASSHSRVSSEPLARYLALHGRTGVRPDSGGPRHPPAAFMRDSLGDIYRGLAFEDDEFCRYTESALVTVANREGNKQLVLTPW